TVRLPGIDDLVAVREAEERVEREPSIGERVAEPTVELRLTAPQDDPVRGSDLAVRDIGNSVGRRVRVHRQLVHDLVLAWGALDGVSQVTLRSEERRVGKE